MENPRPEKVAVVDEVRERLSSSDAALLTEYRGIDVSEMGALRRALRQAGGEYKIYKNTLVRFAARDLGLEIDALLTGPTAIAFVPADADPVVVAKALRDFAKGNPNLIVKGGLLGEKVLTDAEIRSLAEVAPREELLAELAGLMAAPMVQFAGLLQAVPQDFAYALSALVEQGGAPGAPAPAPADEASSTEVPPAPSDEVAPDEPETPSTETPSTETDEPAPTEES
jgi:large subunit ribosomal protein L10